MQSEVRCIQSEVNLRFIQSADSFGAVEDRVLHEARLEQSGIRVLVCTCVLQSGIVLTCSHLDSFCYSEGSCIPDLV